MQAVKIQFVPWDKIYYADANGLELKKGQRVVFRTELGIEIGDILGFEEVKDELLKTAEGEEPRQVLRKANQDDLEKLPDAEKKEKALEDCRKIVEKFNLDMKLVDIHFSFDGSRITLAFIADGRIDFRELAKELTRNFNRTIRLQQIGIRDEARLCGDYGHCGKELCCKGFLKEFVSITSDMAETQQCEHRGSDRISGSCGRLMCCLAFEVKGYQEMKKEMPPLGATVNVDGKRGEVISQHCLKRCVRVKFTDPEGRGGYTISEVDLDRNKKKDKVEPDIDLN